MEYSVTEVMPFNGTLYKIKSDNEDHIIGVANLKEGSNIYYPQAGSEYVLVVFENKIYRFPFSEFIWPFRESYLMEKLKCSKKEAELIYSVVKDEFFKDAAQTLLMGKTSNNLLTGESR